MAHPTNSTVHQKVVETIQNWIINGANSNFGFQKWLSIQLGKPLTYPWGRQGEDFGIATSFFCTLVIPVSYAWVMMDRRPEDSIQMRIDPPNSHSQKGSMACPRCGGYTVRTYYMDEQDFNCLWGVGRRCLNCGEIMDAVISANKRQNISTCQKRPRRLRLRS